ncbi:MAG: DUF5060 domain-containing protein [Clostridia bacterium]|nr:DUF5060 domain-containing protein [Clostridia bacterium]
MKHTLLCAGSVLLAFMLAFSVLPGLPLIASGSSVPLGSNLIEDASSTFTDITNLSQTHWTGTVGSPTVSLITDAETGTCLSFIPNSSYSSPALNLAYYLSGANALSGQYYLSFQYKITYLSGADIPTAPFGVTIRTNTQTSFSPQNPNGQFYADLPSAEESQAGVWYTYTTSFDISDADLAIQDRNWRFCLHRIETDAVASIAIDNISLRRYDETLLAHGVTSAQTWVENEAVFVSDTNYSDPYEDITLDLVLTNGTVTYVIPAFWDGGRVWRVRFVCPSAGTWTYTTTCNVTTDTGLHGQTGTLTCTAYNGDLAVYQHGFIKTAPNTKYFMYDDGTPFFYLGDTHWSLGAETPEMIETVGAHRQSQ